MDPKDDSMFLDRYIPERSLTTYIISVTSWRSLSPARASVMGSTPHTCSRDLLAAYSLMLDGMRSVRWMPRAVSMSGPQQVTVAPVSATAAQDVACSVDESPYLTWSLGML